MVSYRSKKASDVFRKSNPVFGQKVSFEQAFPTIDSAMAEVHEKEMGIVKWNHTHSTPFLGEYIDCSNQICYSGGFSVGQILRDMVRENKTEYNQSDIRCRGYEGSENGRRRYGACLHSFDVKVTVKYKPKPEPSVGQ